MESADAPVSPPTSPVKLPRDGSISIVLDWDDTLLPTTQLTDNYGDYITGGAPLPAHIVEELSALEDIAVEFLDEVAACGEATVITNAMNGSPPFHALLRLRAWLHPTGSHSGFEPACTGWVTLSGRLFVSWPTHPVTLCVLFSSLSLRVALPCASQIPRVLQALSRHNIDVTYAREQHGNVGDAEEWKMTAFSTLVRRLVALEGCRVRLVCGGFLAEAIYIAHRFTKPLSLRTWCRLAIRCSSGMRRTSQRRSTLPPPSRLVRL